MRGIDGSFHKARKFLLIGILCSAGIFLCSCEGKPKIPEDRIETQIRDILSLPTFEHIYHDIVYVGEKSKFLGITTRDRRALFSIDVTVQAGIDFTEGVALSLQSKDTAVVSIPPAKILSIDADETTIHEYFVREVGGAVSRLIYYDEIDRKKEFLREDALNRGILFRAEENAKKLITNFLNLAGFSTVTFETLKPEESKTDGT